MSDFILISIQKSGTDMLSQALGIYEGEYCQIDGMVDPADVHPNQYIVDILRDPWPRGIARSHMHYDDAYLDILKSRQAKIIFCFRDPRDTIVSWLHWIKTRQAAGWFDLDGYSNDHITLWSILTVSKFHFSRFLGWLSDPYIHQVRYEMLIWNRWATLEGISDYLGGRTGSAKDMAQRINPKTSTTFRRGVVGDWVNYFDAEMYDYFNQECGEIMRVMGYGG